MPRLLMCANPNASGFTGGVHREVLARFRAVFDVESEWPKTPQDTQLISAAAAEDGVDIVVAMGGDGVVHHVANGIGGTPSALGIIPAGTTNVLARIASVPSKPTRAADLICSGIEPRALPSAELQLDDRQAGRATFATGMGFDAEVVEVAEQEPYRKLRFGGIHYARSAASVVWNEFADRSPSIHVSSGDRSAEAVAVLVALHDTYTYFGRLPLRFGTYSPGRASVLVARDLPRRRVAPLLVRTATGLQIDSVDGVEVWDDVQELQMTSDGRTPAQADGELLGSPTTMTVTVQPDHLRVVAPAARSSRFRRS